MRGLRSAEVVAIVSIDEPINLEQTDIWDEKNITLYISVSQKL
jgi:hypothetical protein